MSPLSERVAELPVAHPDPVLPSKASPSLWHTRSCAGALGVGFFAWGVCWIWTHRQCVLSSLAISVLTSSVPIPNPEPLLNPGVEAWLSLPFSIYLLQVQGVF